MTWKTTTATAGHCSATPSTSSTTATSRPGRPLHVDLIAFLLARGANPLRTLNGVPVVVEAEIRGQAKRHLSENAL